VVVQRFFTTKMGGILDVSTPSEVLQRIGGPARRTRTTGNEKGSLALEMIQTRADGKRINSSQF
jgi:hypothetical protein